MISFHRFFIIILGILILSSWSGSVFSQQDNCTPPIALPSATETNIFTGDREAYLGEVAAEHIKKRYSIIDDPILTKYLNSIGDRLAQNLPSSDLKLQFSIVDLPSANAFVLPGGRVYVSRKLIALARDEDELAAVIAHELGHLITHESAIEMTRQLREVLNVTVLGDRRDVFEKYNQLLDNYNRKPEAFKRGDHEAGQLVADQAALYALLRSGYDATAFSRIWERLTDVKGKTGNWFSDLFGTTKPEERRLREMLKVVHALPAQCVPKIAAKNNADFTKWQADVIAYSGLGMKESLHGVISKLQLSPPLRSDISHIKFSPNGKYILAQDDSGINVLGREPFAPLFRIEAPDAEAAQFSPDSANIVFSTDNLRVEKWNVAEAKMVAAEEVIVLKGCIQTTLSPDGRFLACLNTTFDLDLIDVSSGQKVLQKREFFRPNYATVWMLAIALANRRFENGDAEVRLINMGFSPDAHFFVAGYPAPPSYMAHNENVIEGFDLETMRKISLPNSIERLLAGGFSFMGSDRIIGVNPLDYTKSALVSFPDGDVILEVPLRGRLDAATKGDFVLIRPIKDNAVGVMNLKTKVIFKASKQSALDIFGDVFVSEMRNGELGLYKIEKNELVATTLLSNFNLGRITVGELSSDMKWLAVSSKTRGGVWNLEKGDAVLYLRGFRGAYLSSEDHLLFADFPKYEAPDGAVAERSIVRFNLDTTEVKPGPKIDESRVYQADNYLVAIKSARSNTKDTDFWRFSKNIILEISDARSMSALWSKPYPDEAPRIWIDPEHNTLVLVWDVNDNAAKTATKGDPMMAKKLAALKETKGDYLVEVLDLKTGNSIGKLLIETGNGSFRMANVFATEDWIVVMDTNNRVSLYSIKSGELRGRVFGSIAAIAPKTHLLCVQNERGKLVIYNLETLEKRQELLFPTSLSMVRFSRDDTRLFVLTSTQIAYTFDATQLGIVDDKISFKLPVAPPISSASL